jgi:protein ImuB
LISPPAEIETLSIVPDGPPVRFTWRRRAHQVVAQRGPERIETGWWRGRTARRDYYRVETALGQRYWLFRRLDDGRWFLHGVFE